MKSGVKFKVMDKDWASKDDLLGHVSVDLDEVQKNGKHAYVEQLTMKGKPCDGHVHFEVFWFESGETAKGRNDGMSLDLPDTLLGLLGTAPKPIVEVPPPPPPTFKEKVIAKLVKAKKKVMKVICMPCGYLCRKKKKIRPADEEFEPDKPSIWYRLCKWIITKISRFIYRNVKRLLKFLWKWTKRAVKAQMRTTWRLMRLMHPVLCLYKPVRGEPEWKKNLTFSGRNRVLTQPQSLQLIWLSFASELLTSVILFHELENHRAPRDYGWRANLADTFRLRLLPVGHHLYNVGDFTAGLRFWSLGAIPAIVAVFVRAFGAWFFRRVVIWGGKEEDGEGPPAWALTLYYTGEDLVDFTKEKLTPCANRLNRWYRWIACLDCEEGDGGDEIDGEPQNHPAAGKTKVPKHGYDLGMQRAFAAFSMLSPRSLKRAQTEGTPIAMDQNKAPPAIPDERTLVERTPEASPQRPGTTLSKFRDDYKSFASPQQGVLSGSGVLATPPQSQPPSPPVTEPQTPSPPTSPPSPGAAAPAPAAPTALKSTRLPILKSFGGGAGVAGSKSGREGESKISTPESVGAANTTMLTPRGNLVGSRSRTLVKETTPAAAPADAAPWPATTGFTPAKVVSPSNDAKRPSTTLKGLPRGQQGVCHATTA